MESLLNFNFLKDISIKKNNENNANDKNLSDDGKAFLVDQHNSIENEFNNIISGHELDKNSLSLEKQKNKKSKEKLNIESADLLLADLNIKNSESEINNNPGYISTKNKKENNSLFNIRKDDYVNINSHKNEGKILNNNLKKVSNQKIIIDSLDNNELSKPLSNFEDTKNKKINLDPHLISNIGKKSKIKSFFQNYFNYT